MFNVCGQLNDYTYNDLIECDLYSCRLNKSAGYEVVKNELM